MKVSYIEEVNPWSVLLLEDGTRIRYRWIVISVEKTGNKNPDGTEEHKLGWATVFDTTSPEAAIVKENLK